MKTEHFEKLSVFNFSTVYPSVCRLEFNPKSKHDSGDIAFHFPDKSKVFLTWGALEKARKKFETLEEYAENSIKVVKKAAKTFERVPPYSLNLNSHNAIYNQTSLSEKSPGLFGAGRQSIKHGTYSIHLYCEESSRFFVIYAVFSSTDESTDESFKEIFMKMANSFQCH
ncbi:MAG: hypothetical protein ACHQ03_09385 [Candidatus Bathyarchaeia archaeon]